jgi:hypothetical protein
MFAKNGAAKHEAYKGHNKHRNEYKFDNRIENTKTGICRCGKKHNMQALKKRASKSTRVTFGKFALMILQQRSGTPTER